MTRPESHAFVFPLPIGAQGLQGSDGPQGPQGPEGPEGPQGATGAGLVSVEDWRGYGGDSTDTGTLLNAIAAAKAAAGMRLNVPAQTYTIDQTLLIDESHIHLNGQGAGHIRSSIAAMQAAPRTKILWNGAVGGTIMKFATPSTLERRMGGGIKGIQLDGNGFRAARGLHLDSWYNGSFDDVCVYACSESQFRLSTLSVASSFNVDTQYNLFTHCLASTYGGSGTYLTSTAYGWHLTGDNVLNTANTSVNTFIDCHAYMSKGIGWRLENIDDNFFYHITGGAPYAVQGVDPGYYSIELGSANQDSINGTGNCRYNTFHGVLSTVIARSGQTGGASSDFNSFYGYSRANAVPRPVIEAPAGGSPTAHFNYWDMKGNTSVAALGLAEASPVPTTTAGLSQLYVDAALGALKLKDGAGAIRTIADIAATGNWTPAFSFATAGDSVITHTIQVGKYLKIGQMVFVIMDLAFSTNAYTTAAGSAKIDGLPYTALTGDGGLAITFLNRVTFDATINQLHLLIPNTTTRVEMRLSTSNVDGTVAGVTNFPASKTGIRIGAAGIYWTA